MSKYKLRDGVGDHFQNGTIYGPGTVIVSEHPLNEAYPNKFDKVDDSTPATAGKGGPQPTIIGGQASPAAISQPQPAAGRGQAPQADTTQPPATAATDVPAGLDVTEKFPAAVEQEFKVYKREGKYYVYDTMGAADPLLNPSGSSKAEVADVIAKALAK